MKYYQTGNNIIPKICGLFMTPLWAVPLAQGFRHSSVLLILLGVVFFILTIWTFMGKSERYVDTIKKTIITQKKWLWFTWGDETSLSNYKFLAVVDYSSTNGSGSGPASVFWHVNLVSQHSSSYGIGNFDNNINLKSFNTKNTSKEVILNAANEMASQLNMKVVIEANFH